MAAIWTCSDMLCTPTVACRCAGAGAVSHRRPAAANTAAAPCVAVTLRIRCCVLVNTALASAVIASATACQCNGSDAASDPQSVSRHSASVAGAYAVMSAPLAPSGHIPPPSMANRTFAGSACSASSSRSSVSKARAMTEPSLHAGSRPASGESITLRTASASAERSSRPSANNSSVNAGSAASRMPRNCRLARWVRSIAPLP